MLFNSIDFLIFFPIVVLIYYLFPKKFRYLWLLFSSYYFYMCWNVKYVALLITSTLVTYVCGILVEKAEKKSTAKACIAVSLIINLGILFVFKYFDFSVTILAQIFEKLHLTVKMPVLNLLLPVGISFYIFQAIGYIIDVYRGEISAERNPFRYALFVSFFPQLVAGPIERSKNLLPQLEKQEKFNFEKARDGFLLMLWGFFLKIVIADRIALVVDIVYGDVETYSGIYIALATILFAFQIYCDFYGYSTIAVGAAKILGIELMENFKAPYLSVSVSDFWRNWHISLTSFFKDYVYIPLGGNKKGKIRKYVNKIIVFLLSGLWHGASLSFVIWGGLNGLFQVLGEILLPIRKRLAKILHYDSEKAGGKLLGGIVTFLLVDFSWLFFRAGNLKYSINVLQHMFPLDNPWILFDGSLYNIMDRKNLLLLFFCLLILFISDICKLKNISIRQIVQKQDYWFRCLFIVFAVLAILVFGMYGPEYDAKNFIYFQF